MDIRDYPLPYHSKFGPGGSRYGLTGAASNAVVSFCGWAILASVAHSEAGDIFNKMPPMIAAGPMFALDAAMVAPLLMAIDEDHMDRRLSLAFFTSSMVGCVISCSCAFLIPKFQNELRRNAWSLSGIFVGALIELTLSPSGRLFRRMHIRQSDS